MTKLDIYLFKQLIGPFAFFCFITSGILLLNQTLEIINIITENGQAAYIVFELSLLLVPKVLVTAIPISGFIASILTINKLFIEQELLVMMSAGRSYIKLCKPFFLFGILITILHFFVVHSLAPYAHKKFLKTEKRIKKEYITQIIKPNQFISHENKYTLFFGNKGNNGELYDILIEEQISPNRTITHIAKNGQVVKKYSSNSILLKNGSTQIYNEILNTFSLLHFDSLVFDLTQLKQEQIKNLKSLSTFNTIRLIRKINKMKSRKTRYGRAISLLNDRFAKNLLSILFPMLGMLILFLGGFNRFGYVKRITSSVIIMASLDLLRGASKSWVVDKPEIWLIQYLSPFLCTSLIMFILFMLSTQSTGLIRINRKLLS